MASTGFEISPKKEPHLKTKSHNLENLSHYMVLQIIIVEFQQQINNCVAK
jgi:hypothetical protein